MRSSCFFLLLLSLVWRASAFQLQLVKPHLVKGQYAQLPEAPGSAQRMQVQLRVEQEPVMSNDGPDLFIPIFVGTALIGYGLILAYDALVNGFCLPLTGVCWGITETGGWGS